MTLLPDERTGPDGAPSAPLFAETRRVGGPSTAPTPEVLAELPGILARNWLTNDGPVVRALEDACAQALGVSHCVAVVNATIGLQVAAHALGLCDGGPGGEVIVPSFTFVGTAHALHWLGLTPVFCDVDPHHHGLDPAQAARLVTPRTRAILGVHLWGHGGDAQALVELGERHGVPVFFDAAHAFGCVHRGTPIGRWGRMAVFSLHATKVMHALEGGLITTEDAALAERLRQLRSYGITDEDRVDGPGLNAKMHEFSAAVGLANLRHTPALIEHNRRLQRIYRQSLAEVPGLRWHTDPDGLEPDSRSNHHYAVLEVMPGARFSRDGLHRRLQAEGVHARRYFQPGCHRHAPYRDRPGPGPALPVTEHLCRSLLQLPTGAQMSEADATRLGGFIRTLATGAALHRHGG